VIAAAVGCALAAALCYAVAATFQHQAARRVPTARTLDPRLLVRVLSRPLWIFGGAADLAGTGLHGAALAFGPLALVQPLLVSGLILAVPVEAALDRRRPGRRDLVAVSLSGAGLATFVAIADPQPGPITPADAPLLGVMIGVGTTMIVVIACALRMAGAARATFLGVATGAGYALAATLAKACIDVFTGTGLGVLADWRLYALAAVGLTSLILNQNAFQAGTLAGPLTGIVLTDPLISIAIAVTAYEEHLMTTGAAVPLQLLGLSVMAWGVWLVTTGRSARDLAGEPR
jgi:hypothetical protein